MQRRDVLKGAAAAFLASPLLAQEELGGPFAGATSRFQAGQQHRLPGWAFTENLAERGLPLVPRPTAVGSYEELVTSSVAFGDGDPVPIGECFHGVAREWGQTPPHWAAYGCNPCLDGAKAWNDKSRHFREMPGHGGTPPVKNWGGFPIKCYKFAIREVLRKLRADVPYPARMYGYGGMVPGPTLKMRLGQPAVVRFENHLEAEMSVHLHGAHSPSHSDGFPTFYVLQGKSRDYFYPNILPLYPNNTSDSAASSAYEVDEAEGQSTMWYHDHAMDATGYNVSKGLAGFAPCFGETELQLIYDRVLPGYGPQSCLDPEQLHLETDPAKVAALEDPENPGYYRREKEPYYNPFDIPLVLQDRVIDRETGQIAFDSTGHNGYLGDTFFVNSVAWPWLEVRDRKYRFRILNGSNARVYRLRILSAEDYHRFVRDGVSGHDGVVAPAPVPAPPAARDYRGHARNFLRIGKDSWLWPNAGEMDSVVLAMANRADIIVDFHELAGDLAPGETREFFLVNTMPQFDGRGPKSKLDDGGDPRVLPLPFDDPEHPLVELERPIGILKFVVSAGRPGTRPGDPADDVEASVSKDCPLNPAIRPIKDQEVSVVREFIFERGKGAWQVNGRFYDPTIANAAPRLNHAEEWVLRNGGGGWWHPIHIHLESHQIVRYEKDFEADAIIDRRDAPARNQLAKLEDVLSRMNSTEAVALHDTQVLGPNTVVRIRMRHRTWSGPFVFHCHNLEHEDMRMMFNFEPVPDLKSPDPPHDPNIVPDARTHGLDVTLHGNPKIMDRYVGELHWEYPPIPQTPVTDAGQEQIAPRPKRSTNDPTPQSP